MFSPETYKKENNLNVRVFVQVFGIPEDPATGSRNGCLAAYLSEYQFFGNTQVRARVEQCYEIRRPSLVLLEAQKNLGIFGIKVGGRVKPVASGKLL